MDSKRIKEMIGSALNSVRSALKGKVKRAVGGKRVIVLQLDGLKGEPFNSTEHFQMPGYRAMPLASMDAVILPMNGRSANSVVVAMSNGALFIADLQDGECAIFNENDGVANSVVLRNGKIMEITCDVLNFKVATSVNFDTPIVNMTHNLAVAEQAKSLTLSVTSAAADASTLAGGLHAEGDISSGDISLGEHRHPENGDITDPPQA
ncbi:phage baseplate assembly protein domain-containing protein [Herminiimonas arsenitoxidans]|uniref:phage baseplate assembly protein domain-containing protein n=1 Tax=Herminiimonas arsenitoxidans TaxID=1809410 RepID=UPI00097060FD|nr:phage baseplate assembly protein [Herminiimonas arsenitoxidans]